MTRDNLLVETLTRFLLVMITVHVIFYVHRVSIAEPVINAKHNLTNYNEPICRYHQEEFPRPLPKPTKSRVRPRVVCSLPAKGCSQLECTEMR